MALSGLQIYKHLPKTNCKDCGLPTCLAFAMQLAAKKASLEKCPHVSAEGKAALDSASQPPIKLVTIGVGDRRLESGNETVMFRHEQTFYHPAGIGFVVEDGPDEAKFKERVCAIDKLRFERVGQKIEIDIVAVKQAGDAAAFAKAVQIAAGATALNLVLMSRDAAAVKAALEAVRMKRPLIYGADKENLALMAGLSKEYGAPLAIIADSLEELSDLSLRAQQAGAVDLVLDSGQKKLPEKIRDLTHIRRLALKRAYRPFGFPSMAVISTKDPFEEVAEAVSFICKYAGIVLMEGIEPWQVLPILTVRQNIYTDPQKPLQVEARVNEVGQVTGSSPVIVTTNFSLTYYTVETEVESSKVPSYIISVDAEGMSVLTAWAAEKFTPEKITEALNKCGIKDKVTHKNVIIPGYVSVLSGKLQEESGWNVKVGPREASGLPAFLKGL